MNIEITIPPESLALVQRLGRFPGQEIAAAMDRENEITIAHIQSQRMQGKGPFPVEQHRLGVVSSRLYKSLRPSLAVVKGEEVLSAIGSNVVYAGAHEEGFKGTVNIPAHQRKGGAGDRFKVGSAIVSRSSARRSGGIKQRERNLVAIGVAQVKAHTRQMNIPARAPIRHGIQDRTQAYGKGISEAIVKAWEGGAE